ncbi:unnamed protein product, partial [Rotaria sp. Silwood2]
MRLPHNMSEKCSDCRDDLYGNAVNIPSKDRYILLFSRNIWISEDARCCSGHLIGNQLTKEAVHAIKSFAIRHQELKCSNIQLLLNKSQTLFENEQRRFNFDDLRGLTDDEYCLLTSLSKNYFNELIEIISTSGIRNSSNRSIRTTIDIYLCKLCLGLSNRHLACMFQLLDKRTISKTIASARQAILKNCVPYNLGLGRVTRQDVIDHHTTAIVRNDLSITCALINCYQPPMITTKPEDSEVGQKIMKLLHQKNRIMLLLEENNLIKRTAQWKTINHCEIMNCFPIISEEDVGDLTF